ncbi:hypothetical protein D3C73_1505830 [compost metagenome]
MQFGVIYRLSQVIVDSRLAQIHLQLQIHVEALAQLALLLEHAVVPVIFHAPQHHFVHDFGSFSSNLLSVHDRIAHLHGLLDLLHVMNADNLAALRNP